jgi:quercetin dioxygenase-like cupin family protein
LFAIASELTLSLDKLLGASIEPKAEPQTEAMSPAEAATFAEYLSFQSGVRWRRLGGTPPDHRVQFLMTEYEPGADSAPGDSPQRHPGDDYGYVLEGTLTVVIEGRERLLTAGQAIFMRGDVPHRLLNRSDSLARAVWCVVG